MGYGTCSVEKMGVKPGFWQGKRVLVTGHTGFKGSWLSLWLQDMGAVVTGYALPPPTSPSLFEVAQIGQGMISILGDVRDAVALAQAVSITRPEIVFHLAAQPLVRASYEQPVETYGINVMGTVHLLEALRKISGLRAVVVVTTDKCYENLEILRGYCETDRLGGYDPYSNSKACAELVVDCYRSSFFNRAQHAHHGVGLATARAGNVIGGGDWAKDRLIPDILRSACSGQSLQIRNPRAIRPWQHVLEPTSGYLCLAQALCEDGAGYAEAWNFGPADDDACEVGWLVDEFGRQSGIKFKRSAAPLEHPHEARYLKLDCTKARERLGWNPRWNLVEALKRIGQWQKAYEAGEEVRELTLSQIHDYCTRLN